MIPSSVIDKLVNINDSVNYSFMIYTGKSDKERMKNELLISKIRVINFQNKGEKQDLNIYRKFDGQLEIY